MPTTKSGATTGAWPNGGRPSAAGRIRHERQGIGGFYSPPLRTSRARR